jgi:glutaconyl-CoA/methylmalonyl-CoA decarboxylase subunit gamma
VRRYTVTVDGIAFTIDVEETAADRFLVTVGDRTFEAALASEEDLPGAVISPGGPVHEEPRAPAGLAPVGPASGGPAAATPGPSRSAAGTPGPAGGGPRPEVLASPMPGVILEVHVAVGTVLRRGDPVLVLEAMKMRNTIRAPHPGVVVAVEVEAGQPVGPGDPLVRLGAAPG